MALFQFPVSHRLMQSREFDAVFRESELRVNNPSLLFLAKRNTRGFNRLGMVVSKKNVPRAVDRNRIKRQIREAFRLCRPNEDGLDVVVLSRPGAARDDVISMRELLRASFDKLAEDAGKSEGQFPA